MRFILLIKMKSFQTVCSQQGVNPSNWSAPLPSRANPYSDHIAWHHGWPKALSWDAKFLLTQVVVHWGVNWFGLYQAVGPSSRSHIRVGNQLARSNKLGSTGKPCPLLHFRPLFVVLLSTAGATYILDWPLLNLLWINQCVTDSLSC